MSGGPAEPHTPPPAPAWPAAHGPAFLAPPPAQDTRLRTLALYLLGGVGVFVVTGALVARLVGEDTSILASLAAYLLNFACFAGAAYLLGLYRQGLSWREFGLRPFAPAWLGAALLGALALLPLRACVALAAQMTLGGGMDQLEPRLDLIVPEGAAGLNLAVTLLGAGLLAPMAEELYFRGLLHRWFWARLPERPWLRVALSAAVFGLGHFDSVGVAASSFLLGALCAVVYERSRSLWLAIAVHAANNSLAVVLVYASLALLENAPAP